MARHEFSYRSLHGAPRGRQRLLFASFLVLVIFAIDIASHGAVRNAIRSSESVLWRATASVRETLLGGAYFTSKRSLATENASLRTLVADDKARESTYSALADENRALREMLGLREREAGITAPVVSSFRSSPYGTFLIGASESDGIKNGDIVLTSQGFVLGRVVDVGNRTASVRSAFASASRIDVLISNVAAEAEGHGSGNARVFVPRGIMIATGTPVISASFGQRPIGIVGHVVSDESRADQVVYVSLPVELSTLRYVYVVPSNQ
ncbi:rod shape-determining protein MreC [Candidatus Kaiserbacteria bacterium]|nr:rod shape-determining protein MreC [Candidatus Kaiserbacteria bacterium]